jgi:hypothetical protein
VAAADRVPVIAVASGKGGVGKTTVAVNLALALRAQGHGVGLVDADLYGPDVPRMLGLRRRQDASSVTLFAAPGQSGSRLEVVERHGIQMTSAAFLIGENQGLGIQTDIAQLMVRRLLADADWKDVDYLVVDLPPGTADIQQFVFGLSVRPHRGPPNRGSCLAPVPRRIEERATREARRGQAPWRRAGNRAPFSAQAARDADQGLPVMVTGAVSAQAAAYRLLAQMLQRLISPA